MRGLNPVDMLREIDLQELPSTPEVGRRVVDACRHARLVVVRAGAQRASRREFWDEALAGQAGRVPVDEHYGTGKQTGALWTDVVFDPSRQHTYRHSSSAQPLHTDGSYLDDPPPVILMVCARPAPKGGATIFLDGLELVRRLRNDRPELLPPLTSLPMVFGKAGSQATTTVIGPGSLPRLRWNFHAIQRPMPDETEAVASAFQAFLHDLMERAVPIPITLQHGDAVLFHDDLVLHGREAFRATAPGDRCLWKAGIRI